MSAKIISLINNKGGVGKTTSTGVIAELLAYLGAKVLCVDIDQQSNLSMMFNCYIEDSDDVINGIVQPDEKNIAELFKYRYRSAYDVRSLIRETPVRNLHIIPSSKRHKKTPLNINSNETGNNNIILKKALATIREDFDYILIDNAPASDILTVNSMFASDYILTPVRVEAFSYKGLKETLDSIAYIKEEHDLENCNFLGAFITQAELNTNIYKDLNRQYQTELGAKFLKTPIRKDIKISEIETVFMPLLEYCSTANAIFDYGNLILELDILNQKEKTLLKKAMGL